MLRVRSRPPATPRKLRNLRKLRTLASVIPLAAVLGLFLSPIPVQADTVSPALEKALDAACERARPSIVTVLGMREHESLRADASGQARPSRSLASGVVIDRRGHVVTTASAVRDCDRIHVRLADGRGMTAILLGVDETSDLALLKLPVSDVPPVRMPNGPVNVVGSPVAAMGQAPYNQPRQSLGTVLKRYDRPLASYLLLTNEVYPGYGGGAVLTANGELAGLVVGRLAEVPADWTEAKDVGEKASFALAADDLRDLVSQLERYGRVRRGFLGVTMVQGEVVDAQRPNEPFRIGVRVQEVLAGSPAQQVGLRVGDLIVGWNGETLQSPEDLRRRVESSPPGTVANLVWVRGEDRHDGKLVIDTRPDDELLASPVTIPSGSGTSAEVTPGAGTVDSAQLRRDREFLLEKVRTLRARAPAGVPDSARGVPGEAEPG